MANTSIWVLSQLISGSRHDLLVVNTIYLAIYLTIGYSLSQQLSCTPD